MLKHLVLASALALAAVAPAKAMDEDFFVIRNTKDLLEICTVATDQPEYLASIAFCHGYLTGAYQYYEAMMAGPKAEKLVCLPTPEPTRQQGADMFITWLKANPRFHNEIPAESLLRFLVATFPCKK